MKCQKHKVEMEEMDCSRCGGDGAVSENDDFTGDEVTRKCWVCNGKGMGGYSCDLCADEEMESEWEKNKQYWPEAGFP